jgi:PAS domain S-box-containing protein
LESSSQAPSASSVRIPAASSIGLRLVLLICGVVLFTAGVLGTLGFSAYRNALLGQQLRELEVLVGSAEARLSQLARSIELQVGALALEDDLRDAMRAVVLGGASGQHDRLLTELEDLAAIDPAIVTLQLYDVSGLPVAGLVRGPAGLSPKRVYHEFPAEPAALELARRSPEGFVRALGPHVARDAGGLRTLRLQVGAPVFDANDARIGVVYAEYDLRAALEDIRSDARQRLGRLAPQFAVIDLDGQVVGDLLASPLESLTPDMMSMVAGSLRRAASEVMEAGGSSYGVAAAALAYSSPDPGRSGLVLLAAPRAHLIGQVREAILRGAVAASVFTLIAMALGLAFARGLLGPLNQLLAAVQRFGAGEPVGDLPIRRRDEVGRLARAFGDMVRQVEERSQALARVIKERERTEDALREKAHRLEISESRYRQLYDSIAVGVCITAPDGWVQSANPAYVSLLGYPSEGAIREAHAGRDLWVGPESREAYLRKVRQEGELTAVELRLRRRDGRIVWVLENTRALWNEGGEVTGYESIVVDITERKHAEYAQRASELRFRRLADSNLIGVAFGSVTLGEIREANSYVLQMLGYTERDLPLPLHAILADPAELLARAGDSRLLDQPAAPLEKHLRAADGSAVPALINVAVVDTRRDEFVAAVIDRSSEVQSRRELSELKEFFRFILDASPTRIAYVDAAERVVFFNEPYLRWYGATAEHVQGRPLRDVIGAAAYGVASPEIRRVLAGEPRRFDAAVTRDGRQLHFDITYVPHRGDDGSVLGFISVAHDVTEIRALEARLRQSQKLEALGELTGGIAHDFNNLLSVVIGNLQLCDRQVIAGDRGRRPLEAALRAATRGAELTRRLLSFARLQPMQRCALDAGRQLAEMQDMLLRTLGGSIRVEVDVREGLWSVDTDPGQLENALLNLAINARDAMAGNGTLTLSAANVSLGPGDAGSGEALEPGEYVSIKVADDGPGMSPEVLARAFEPFFSTKPIGQGSGLGLAMVYGFARQSGGAVRLASREGEGTTVELLLRRAQAEAAGPAPEQAAQLPGGRETLLVVEDDDDVRVTTVAVLAELGYRVLDARDARAALAVLEREPSVALLLTDVVLRGGMRGTELAVESTRRRPDLRVIFTTGFADVRNLMRNGALGSEPLWKPLDPREVAARVREALDAPPDRQLASA